MKCTIVIPCHNEEKNIRPLYEAIKKAAADYPEIAVLFVDDGSTDATLERIRDLRNEDPRVKYISFITNYGHQKALLAGLRECSDGFAITMDGDLQHPPRYIPIFIEEYRRGGAEVVLGRRKSSQKGFWKPLFSRLFYTCFSLFTGIHVQPDTSDFRLVSRKVIDILCSIRESDPFLRGIIARLKFPTRIVDYDLEQRREGLPSYTFGKSLRMAFASLLRFSGLPYRVGLILGFSGIVLSLLEAVHYAYLRLFTDALVPGQADLMVFLGLVSSLILIILSLLFKVVTQIRSELAGDPAYVIAERKTD
jgi:polyisoprenyl-phosphate glycosyltransferase